MPPPKTALFVVSVESIQQEPCISSDGRFLKSAVIKGVSQDSEDSFEIRTGPLSSEQIRRCELLQRHGSTVVEIPHTWKWEHGENWEGEVIKAAMDRVAKRYENDEV